MRFRETERGQRAQIGDLESGRITSASPTGRPAGRRNRRQVYLSRSARPIEEGPDGAGLVFSLGWRRCRAVQLRLPGRRILALLATVDRACCGRPDAVPTTPGALCGCDLVIAPHRPRAPRRPRRYPARLAMSSGVSRRLAAATFSSRWARLPVPGMGSITGEAASSAAGATCWTVACAGRRSSRAGSCRWDRGRRRAGRTARTRCRTGCTPPAARRPRWRPRGTRSAPRRPGRSRGPRRVARRRRC